MALDDDWIEKTIWNICATSHRALPKDVSYLPMHVDGRGEVAYAAKIVSHLSVHTDDQDDIA